MFADWFQRARMALLLVVCPAVGAQAGADLDKAATPAATNAPLKQISANVFEIGLVRLDKAARTVSFPGVVNMQEGLMEYLVVCHNGKIHESVFITEAEPYHIHLAMLFLGAKTAPSMTPEQRVAEKEMAGEPITIWITWQPHGEAKRARGESFILHTATRQPMSEGPWTYSGSWVFEGTFLAQRERSIVAIFTDYDALANNPRPGRDNDELWLANKDKVPPPGTKVTVTFELPPLKSGSQTR
jgi:hypothetical protein